MKTTVKTKLKESPFERRYGKKRRTEMKSSLRINTDISQTYVLTKSDRQL